MKLKQNGKDLLITAGCLAAATGTCFLLSRIYNDNNPFAMPVFILAVALTARFTKGYIWGTVASVISVFAVNTLFTFPFGEFTLSLEGYPLNFFCMLAVAVIISALTTRIVQQEEYRAEMEREKMRANLLRGVSHDLRTPLAAISGACSALLQREELPEEERIALLKGIDQDAQWLIRVTENLLSVTRLSGGNAPIKKEEELPEEILSSAAQKFKRIYPAFTVDIHRPEQIFLVPMDGILIEQVLVNLMENAALHGKNADTVMLSVEEKEKRAVFRIIDNGTGFSDKQLRAFKQGLLPETEGRSDAKRNMGIGLSVCRSIIEAHGGTLYLKNSERGAEVSFILPMQ